MNKNSELFNKIMGVLLSILLIIANFSSSVVLAEPTNDKDYTYLSDMKYDSATSGWKDSRAIQMDCNESGNIISLLVDGVTTYFLKGVFAHATSTVVYDLRNLGYDTFSTYVGVDSTRNASGNGVKFTIFVSENGKDWINKKVTGVLKGNTDAVKVTIDITGYNYLKLYADNNGNQDSDHAVYADAMLYKKDVYKPKDTKVDYIRPLTEYDSILTTKSNEEILSDNELLLLQRTLVKRVTYPILQAIASSNDDNNAMMNWLFNNPNVLKQYLVGGMPIGSYAKSLDVLAKLYKNYRADLNSAHSDTFLTMMLAISLTHSSNVCFWVSGEHNERVCSDPVERYKVLKDLYLKGLNGEVEFETEIFSSLTVEEMRWVVDNQLSDEEIPWLNWYSTHTKPVKADGELDPQGTTKYSGRSAAHTSKNPYTYIAYYQGWNYYDQNYYNGNRALCGTDAKNKNEKGYQRTLSCEEEYHLTEWGVGTNSTAKPRLWIVFEEDGVCGALSKTGANLEASYGVPTAVIGQPGHAAYLVASKKKDSDGKFVTTWGIGNAAAGWAQSEKGERFPLNWGSKANGWHSYYNVSYILLIQRALDNFKDYENAFMRLLIADVFEENVARDIATYEEALQIQPYNLDAWYGLINAYKEDKSKTSADFYALGQRVMNAMKEWPLPMVDLLNLIEEEINTANKTAFGNEKKAVLTEMSKAKDSDYLQANVIRDMANSLLGTAKNMTVATFSFDGENANKLVLAGVYAEEKSAFEYTINYNSPDFDPEKDWILIPGNQIEVDLSDKLDELNDLDDIYVHIMGTDRDIKNLYIIDLKEASAPTNLYANDLENRVIGTTDTMEWKIATEKNSTWTKFKDKMPDLTGDKHVLVRNGYSGVTLPSTSVEFTFEKDIDDPANTYIPVSRLTATASTNQGGEGPEKAIDANPKTIWHTLWDGSDHDKWISIKIDGGATISKIDYMPRQDNSLNGRIVKAKVEVSLDGENWDTVVDEVSFVNDMTTKTIFLETPTFANYVKITGLETKGPGSYASAAMINLYENTLNKTKDVKDLDISYISNGYIYNGNPQEPTLKIMDKDKELILNEHYKLEFGNNINAGEATITITGLGIYTGTVTKTFTISKANKPAILPELKMEASANEDYLRDLTLIAGWHWENPDTLLKAGKTIDAIAVFEDTANYENPKVTISVTKDVGNKPEITTSKDKFVFKIGVDEEKPLEYFLSFVKITDVEDGEIAIDSGKVEITSDLKDYQTAGTYHINIKVTDSDDNAQELALEISLIDPNSEFIDISKFKVELKDESYVYSGEEIKPTVLVKDKDHTLTPDVDYDVKYINNINAGDGAVIITGKGMYKGSLSKTFIIKKRPVPTKSIFPSITVSKDTINLGSIDLPEGWAWQNEDQKLVVGENKVKVIYLGDMNHERYETEVIVIKEDKEDNNQESKPSETPSTPEVKPEDNTNNNSTNKPNNTPNNSNSNTNSNTNTNTNTNSNVTSPSTQDDTKKDSEAVSKDEAKEEDKKDSTLKEESNMPLGSLERQGESEYERVRAIEDNIAIIGMVVTALLIGGILIFTKRR